MINTASIGSVGIIGIGAMGWPWRWICSGAAIRPACATAIRERWQPLLHADWLPVILPPRWRRAATPQSWWSSTQFRLTRRCSEKEVWAAWSRRCAQPARGDKP